ncbi:MAG: DNA-processing protein DprA, partial [Spirochaetales bacterium]|nr:DNA-processing protein DprA [Spirochaetales bacterium]
MSDSLIIALALNRIRSISCAEKLRLAGTLRSLHDLETLSLGDLENTIGRRTRIRVWEPENWVKQAERDEKGLTAGDFKCNFYSERDYPPLLREIHDPPFLLFYRGTLPPPERPALAIVGTRYPTGCGRKAAFELGLEVGKAGIPVVSGLAKGVDTAAHEGNTASGGRSIGVLGCGIDRIYPLSSAGAARRMLDGGGCIISEYGTGVPPLKYHFPERNRIIAGISRAVVVVEAPEKSGALITAEFALEEGRDLYVHGRCIAGRINGGCRRLESEGAELVGNGSDILRAWGFGNGSVSKPADETRESWSKDSGCAILQKELEGQLVSYAGEYYE